MDIGAAFTFMFEDKDWIKKIFIGSAIFLVASLLSSTIAGLVIFFPLMGYMVALIQNVRNGQGYPLPEWDNFGDLFIKGGIATVIMLIYNALTLLIGFCFTIAVIVIRVLGNSIDPALGNALYILVACLGCLLPIVGLIGLFFTPIALIQYAHYETFGAAFAFGEIFAFIKANLGEYIMVVLVLLVAHGVASIVGLLLICVGGIALTSFWMILVTGHLSGQLAGRDSQPRYLPEG